MAMMKTSLLARWKIPGMIVVVFLLFICAVWLAYNHRGGYFLFSPFKLDEPLTWKTFQSQLKPISMFYPASWIAHETPQGNHGDLEVIAYITPIAHDYPYVKIAHQEISRPSLDEVASWGESRITFPSRVLISLTKIDVQGQTVLLRNYTYVDWREKKINCKHVYLLKGDDAYIIEMCVDQKNDSPKLQSAWKQMIESISISESS